MALAQSLHAPKTLLATLSNTTYFVEWRLLKVRVKPTLLAISNTSHSIWPRQWENSIPNTQTSWTNTNTITCPQAACLTVGMLENTQLLLPHPASTDTSSDYASLCLTWNMHERDESARSTQSVRYTHGHWERQGHSLTWIHPRLMSSYTSKQSHSSSSYTAVHE